MIPIGTDYRMRIRPWVNYALAGANVLLFLAGWHGMTAESNRQIANLMLRPDAPRVFQFFSCMFLHANWEHLLGNMVFLWVFGNALNDRLGHLAYLLFYLAGGIIAAFGYLVLTPNAPVLGASGAISAVAGAYLVLFPRVRVTLLFWFIFITTFQVSSLLFIGLEVAWNFWMSYRDIVGSKLGGVAYVAHSSGYLFGIAVAAGLLIVRLLPRDQNDLLYLIRHGGRRRRYQRMAEKGLDAFGPNRTRQDESPRRVRATTDVVGREDTAGGRELQLRRDIASAVRQGDLAGAATLYQQVLQINDEIVLPRQQQLDIANQLMAMEHYQAAAEAYERFLRHFSSYDHLADIQLMLGLIYSRYVKKHPRAVELLTQAAKGLSDPRNKNLAETELRALRQNTDG